MGFFFCYSCRWHTNTVVPQFSNSLELEFLKSRTNQFEKKLPRALNLRSQTVNVNLRTCTGREMSHAARLSVETKGNASVSFYRALNIRVPLIGLEVWTERDHCIVTNDPNKTLWSFLQWRQKLKSRKKHDNAQLLTGVIFTGTTIGMAPLEGMCSPENSGGINVDHSDLPIGAAATMAHEIGHNFGMSHDNEGCCVEVTAKQGGCMMNAATGYTFR
uniref:Peptidase M12B domain-containing protein n=1 Tax=Paramormyrops kingsleyae TaxID=1676925 RepID=A0A3B3T8I4_9TELE